MNTANQLYNSLDTLGWVLLFGSLVMYWLKKMEEVRLINKGKGLKGWVLIKTTISDFWSDNFIEVPISFASCLLLAFLAPFIPPVILDMKSYGSLLFIGFGGGSAINGIITKFKPKQP